jgi:hypothetical protein
MRPLPCPNWDDCPQWVAGGSPLMSGFPIRMVSSVMCALDPPLTERLRCKPVSAQETECSAPTSVEEVGSRRSLFRRAADERFAAGG